MGLIQKIKEQGNQASVLLPDVVASNEVITVDITGSVMRQGNSYTIIDPAKTQILDWAKGKAKFLRLTFKHMSNRYGSVWFTKDAISDTDTLDYGKLDNFYIASNISHLIGVKFFFDLKIDFTAGSVFFYAYLVNITDG